MKIQKAKTAKAAGETSPSKKSQDLKKINVAAETKKSVEERLTKYIYPIEMKTPQQKKDYRRKMRGELKKLTSLLNKLRKSKEPEAEKELHKAEKEFSHFTKEHYNVGALA